MTVSTEIVIAIIVFGVIALAEPFVESFVHGLSKKDAAMQWAWDHFLSRVLRAVGLVLFVYLAYPALFGLQVAPSVSELIAADDARNSTIVGAVLVLGFFVSFVPGFSSRPEFALPAQACLATGFVFVWLTSYLGITTATLWPGLDILLAMIGVSYFAHRCAGIVGAALGSGLDQKFNRKGYDDVIAHTVELLAQVPVVLLFGFGLGRQLAI